MVSRKEAGALEQQTLKLSIGLVLATVVGSLVFGVMIESEAVILNGIFSSLSLISGGMSLLAARMVARPEDRRFPYGYAHIEPLVLSANALILFGVCFYALVNGVRGVLAGGGAVNAAGVVVFGAVTGVVNLSMWAYESRVFRRTGSLILKDDAREWLLDAGFSLVTFAAFILIFFLDDPWRSLWAAYADSAMVAAMALLALPIPIAVLRRSMPEVLMMHATEHEVSERLLFALEELKSEPGVLACKPRVVKTGRTYFVEVDILVGPGFKHQTVEEQDRLRERIYKSMELPLEETWLSVSFTLEPRWI